MRRAGAIAWAAAFSMAIALPAAADRVWYEGGTLHEAPLSQWRAADASNRLATAADFAVVVLGMDFVQRVGMPRIKPYAQQLVACIDTLAENPKNAAVAANQAAATCTDEFGWV